MAPENSQEGMQLGGVLLSRWGMDASLLKRESACRICYNRASNKICQLHTAIPLRSLTHQISTVSLALNEASLSSF